MLECSCGETGNEFFFNVLGIHEEALDKGPDFFQCPRAQEHEAAGKVRNGINLP
jgi:hypothetical protein